MNTALCTQDEVGCSSWHTLILSYRQWFFCHVFGFLVVRLLSHVIVSFLSLSLALLPPFVVIARYTSMSFSSKQDGRQRLLGICIRGTLRERVGLKNICKEHPPPSSSEPLHPPHSLQEVASCCDRSRATACPGRNVILCNIGNRKLPVFTPEER